MVAYTVRREWERESECVLFKQLGAQGAAKGAKASLDRMTSVWFKWFGGVLMFVKQISCDRESDGV